MVDPFVDVDVQFLIRLSERQPAMSALFQSLVSTSRLGCARTPLRTPMNSFARSISLLSLAARPPVRSSLPAVQPALGRSSLPLTRQFHQSPSCNATLNQVQRGARKPVKRKTKAPALTGCQQRKGVITYIGIKKPKKPNSAERKFAKVKLTNGFHVSAYVMGEGHNLQEHGVVLLRGGRTQDLGLK